MMIKPEMILIFRFAMIIDDGVVKDLQIEPDGTGMTCSLVENIITKL